MRMPDLSNKGIQLSHLLFTKFEPWYLETQKSKSFKLILLCDDIRILPFLFSTKLDIFSSKLHIHFNFLRLVRGISIRYLVKNLYDNKITTYIA